MMRVFAISLFLVFGAAFAAPTLKERLLQKVAKKSSDDYWPAQWIEFATLAGRCEVVQLLNISLPEESTLSQICPTVWSFAEYLGDEDPESEALATVSEILWNMFREVQCANLETQREWVMFIANEGNGNSTLGNAFLQDSQHLSDKCHDIYSDVAGDINEGVEEAEEEAEEELEEGTEEEEEEEGDGDQGEGQQGEGQGQVGQLVKKALEKHLLQNKLKLMLRKLLQ